MENSRKAEAGPRDPKNWRHFVGGEGSEQQPKQVSGDLDPSSPEDGPRRGQALGQQEGKEQGTRRSKRGNRPAAVQSAAG